MNNISILNILSNHDRLSFEEYNKAFDFLYKEILSDNKNINYTRFGILRWLEALGHCEIDMDGRMVMPCKPILVLLPGQGCRRVVLSGARSPYLVSQISKLESQFKDTVDISIVPQEYQSIPFPECIYLQAVEIDTLAAASDFLNVEFTQTTPIAWIIAHISGTINEYESRLEYSQLPEDQSIRVFDPDKICFQSVSNCKRDSGLMEYQHRITHQKFYKWLYNGKCYKVERDWGRYLDLKYCRKQVLAYDDRKELFVVPSLVPLPKLLMRSLALCSGQIAHLYLTSSMLCDIPKETDVEVFTGVPPTIARLIFEKLGQPYYNRSINIEGDRLS